MYVEPNFRSKAALIRALKSGEAVSVFSPGPFPCPTDGRTTIEGPHSPEPHRWYAAVVLQDGAIVSVDGKRVGLPAEELGIRGFDSEDEAREFLARGGLR